jgi:hypothetical protein
MNGGARAASRMVVRASTRKGRHDPALLPKLPVALHPRLGGAPHGLPPVRPGARAGRGRAGGARLPPVRRRRSGAFTVSRHRGGDAGADGAAAVGAPLSRPRRDAAGSRGGRLGYAGAPARSAIRGSAARGSSRPGNAAGGRSRWRIQRPTPGTSIGAPEQLQGVRRLGAEAAWGGWLGAGRVRGSRLGGRIRRGPARERGKRSGPRRPRRRRCVALKRRPAQGPPVRAPGRLERTTARADPSRDHRRRALRHGLSSGVSTSFTSSKRAVHADAFTPFRRALRGIGVSRSAASRERITRSGRSPPLAPPVWGR